jgi:2-polyprenyl-3-methyl-5-hydroxy-6-metoxy-1,4-benzoquinol methylase
VEVFGDTLAKCRRCGLIFLSPPPTTEEMIRRHQSKEYAEHPYFAAGEEVNEAEALPVHKLVLERLSGSLPSGSRLLDIGAGTGDFLRYSSAHFEVGAVEASALLADRIRRRISCPVFVGAFEDYEGRETADAVVMMDIIEHCADPRRLLQKAHETLRPGGMLAITTVDSGCLLYALGPLTWRLSGALHKAKYVLQRIFCYQHNWYFNRAVLRGVVEQAGFTVAEHRGFEFPLRRLRESSVILAGLRVLYATHAVLGVKTEQYLLARK